MMLIELLGKYEIKATLVGERKDISIESKYNLTLFSYLNHIVPTLDMDIIKKKFGKVVNNILMA